MKIGFLHHANPFADDLLLRLRTAIEQHEILAWITGEAAPARDLDALISIGQVERKQLADQPNLALIQTASAGYEEVDMDAASELGIWVSNAPSNLTGNAISVAEFAVLLLLAASRHLNQAIHSVRDHTVKPSMLNSALSGKTVCVVGLGSIGRLLVDRLRPFGLRIVATDEFPEHAPADVTVFPANQLEAAVAGADYVVICIPASKENEHLIDATLLRAMKRGVILINVARGMLVDESALLAALQSGQVAAVGLDVMEVEPIDPKNPLLALSQVIVTPHIAGFTDLMLTGTVEYLRLVFEEFSAGKKSKSILNSPVNPRRPLHS